MIDKETYQKQLEAQMSLWQAEIAKWQAKAQEAQAELQTEYAKQMSQLKEQHGDAKGEFDKLQAASVDAWKEVKSGADKAWEEMAKAMTNAMKKFG